VIRDGGLPSRRAPAKAPEADGREPRRRRRRNLVSYRFLLYLCLLKPIARTLTCSGQHDSISQTRTGQHMGGARGQLSPSGGAEELAWRERPGGPR
jgi:hypothetical protein